MDALVLSGCLRLLQLPGTGGLGDGAPGAVVGADGAAPALVHIVVHLAVVVLVERTEVANLRALAAVDALVLVPVNLPVGFGIDQAGAGLIAICIGKQHRPSQLQMKPSSPFCMSPLALNSRTFFFMSSLTCPTGEIRLS